MRLMQEEGIAGLPAKREFRGGTTDVDLEDAIADNVCKRNFTAERPNEASRDGSPLGPRRPIRQRQLPC